MQTQSLTLKEVAEANEASISSIRSLAVRVRCSQSKAGGPLAETENYFYRTQGPEERLTLNRIGLPATETGDNMGYSDTYNGPRGMKSIVGYDPAHPPKLGESSLSGAQGNLGPRFMGARRPTSIPRNQLLLEVAYSAQSWTLKDLIATSSARLVATPSTSSRHCYEIQVTRPDVGFHVSVDPAANFMIRRLEIAPSAATKPKVSVFLEVESFQDCGAEVFIPTLIQGEMREGEAITRIRTECEVITCNQTLPTDAFEMVFPDWLRVVDQNSGKIHYWGPDNKPRLTFENAEEHRRWWRPRFNKAMQARYARHFPWSLVLGGITAAFVLILILRKRARARRAAA